MLPKSPIRSQLEKSAIISSKSGNRGNGCPLLSTMLSGNRGNGCPFPKSLEQVMPPWLWLIRGNPLTMIFYLLEAGL